MQPDAFSSGIEPGGLTSKFEIKILICYVLSNAETALSNEQLLDILSKDGLVNYFEAAACIAELCDDGHIALNDGRYSISASGEDIAKTLENSVPISVRTKAVGAAFKTQRRHRNNSENKVTIKKDTNGGYIVQCDVMDRGKTLLSTSILVFDKLQADIIKERFLDDPSFIYSSTMALYTTDKDKVGHIIEDSMQ